MTVLFLIRLWCYRYYTYVFCVSPYINKGRNVFQKMSQEKTSTIKEMSERLRRGWNHIWTNQFTLELRVKFSAALTTVSTEMLAGSAWGHSLWYTVIYIVLKSLAFLIKQVKVWFACHVRLRPTFFDNPFLIPLIISHFLAFFVWALDFWFRILLVSSLYICKYHVCMWPSNSFWYHFQGGVTGDEWTVNSIYV